MRYPRPLAAVVLGALLALSAAAASATDVRLVNFAAYSYVGSTADLETDGVRNFDDMSPTGPLRLELWAFASPYTLGMGGYRLAVYDLPAMNAGTQTGPIDSGPVPFSGPPIGVWYFSMILTEFVEGSQGDDGYVLRYFINFPTPEYIGVPPPPNKVQAVEFYHSGMDHYFITASASDIHDLDTGVQQGWSRTGYSFFVWDAAGGNGVPVCRYYIPPGYGDSHFFSGSSYECGIAPVMFPWIMKESDAAFYIALPDSAGACAGNEVPVDRLWNGRIDSNHRYTTSAAVKALMIANGYVDEGVTMCAPP